MNDNKITRGSTLFLRLAIVGIGLVVLGICGLLLTGFSSVDKEYPEYWGWVAVVLSVVIVSAVPFYYGLFKAWSVLRLIDDGKALSFTVVRKLRIIYRCAGLIGALYLVSLPAFYIWAELDDAPGLVIVGMVFTMVPIIVSVAISVLQRLLNEAIKLKNE